MAIYSRRSSQRPQSGGCTELPVDVGDGIIDNQLKFGIISNVLSVRNGSYLIFFGEKGTY